jgi:hypothetical protein
MADQVLYRNVVTEGSVGETVLTRHITEVVVVKNERIVALFGPSGETNLRHADDDEWTIRVEGFEPNKDMAVVWVVDDAPVEATRAVVRTSPKGIFEQTGKAPELLALGVPAPAAGGSRLAFSFGGAVSNAITFLP